MNSLNVKTTSSGPLFLVLSFFTASFIISCSKSSDNVTNQNNTARAIIEREDSTITDTSIYIDITLDKNRLLRIQNINDAATWGIIWGPLPVDSSVYPYNRIGSAFSHDFSIPGPSFEFSKGNVGFHSIGGGGLPADFTESFFAPGNYNYSVKTLDTTYNYLGTPTDTVTLFSSYYTKTLLSSGVNILYYDSNGTAWETINGSADQTGSFFTISKAEPIMNGNITGKPVGAIVTASFDCKLYDNKGNSMHLTNGSFRQILYY